MRKKIAVLFGGRSTEHEISVITGLEIISAMDSQRYDAFPVYIDPRGRWFTGTELLDKSFYKSMPGSLSKMKEVALLPIPGEGGLIVLDSLRGKGFSLFATKAETIPVDVFFPAFHGSFGEDGCLQGLFEMADVVYTGCNVLSSAIAMNKYLCKSVMYAHGIPILPAAVIKKELAQRDLAEARKRITSTKGLEEFPLFVKPVNLGSSVGVGKANNQAELDAALVKAFQFDVEAIVEPCIANKLEINVSIRDGKEPFASVTEVPVASDGTLTYEDKYLRGGGKKGKGKAAQPQRIQGMAGLSRVIDAEDLQPEFKQGATAYALDAYRILGCAGVVRFDFIIDLNTNKLYFNELNPLPGSMAHYLWEKTKPPVLYTEFLSTMIETALGRKEQTAGLERSIGFKALFN